MSEYQYKVSAAGRVNLIGEHVDYCGGKVMPCALSLATTIYVRRNDSQFINLSWTTLPDKVSMDVSDLEKYRAHRHAKYFAGCAALWKQSGHSLVGCDLLIDCKVPFGSGLSSSASIEVATLAALAAISNEKVSPVEIALIAQKAEHDYAGVNCGIMDQYASACGKAGHAMLLDCKTLDCKYVPVSTGEYSLVIINSNKPHNLVESRYNERRQETELALQLLQSKLNVTCLAEVSPSELETHKDLLSATVYKRAKHVVEECERVRLAEAAMSCGDMVEFGRLLNSSHESLSELYEVTGVELDTLAHIAQSHPQCAGSRMTGGGFGGCTVSLVKTAALDDFKQFVVKKYKEQIGYNAVCYDTGIADGIVITKLEGGTL